MSCSSVAHYIIFLENFIFQIFYEYNYIPKIYKVEEIVIEK